MSGSEFIWGLILVVCGVFICVYGSLLFRYVLSVIGFAAGFGVTMALTTSQDTAVRIVVSLVIGGIAAAILYFLFRLALYIAGGMLGAVIALVVASLLGFLDSGLGASGIISLIIGTGLVGFFGPRLGKLIIVLGTAAAGAFLTIEGLAVWFHDELRTDNSDPSTMLSHHAALVTMLVIAAISGLAQYSRERMPVRIRR